MASCATVPHKIQETKIENNLGRYSYEGMVGPGVIFETWTEIKTDFIGGGWFRVYYINPNDNSKIRIASILMSPDGLVRAYAYLYNNEPYLFILNDEGCYKLFEVTDEEVKESIKQNLLDALNGAIT